MPLGMPKLRTSSANTNRGILEKVQCVFAEVSGKFSYSTVSGDEIGSLSLNQLLEAVFRKT